MIVYGIPTCTSVRRAIAWLNRSGIAFTFHDFKKSGITAARLNTWSKEVGWEPLLNKKSTTWRELDAGQKALAVNQKGAIQVMQSNPGLIKRPVIEYEDGIIVGFNESQYEENLR